jgi:tetratricopeptide (TPR) repeat protein
MRFLLSVDPGDPAIVAMDPLARRRKVFDAVRALAVRGATLKPVVFVFEDLHWVDTSSEEYLGALMDSVAGAAIVLVMTYRVGYAPPFGGRSFHTTLTLQNLTAEETLAMAGRILGTDHFPEQVKAALMDKAEGVPLFVEEVTKTLLDLGVLRREGAGLAVAKGLSEVSVPDTMQGIIMARLDRLGDAGKRTVQLASVIGRRFLVRLLDRIGGMREQLHGLLAELKALEIIYEQGLLPEPAYIFKHAVIQDVAYNSLLKERRRELHRAVGDAIEELYADRLSEHHEELAHHYVNGEQWAKAFDYLVKSGDRAKDAYANQLALDFYARALDVASRTSPALTPWQVMDVHQRRGRVWLLLAKYQEAIAESQRMLEVARAAGDRHGEGEALVDLALEHYMTFASENMPLTKRLAEEALAIAEQTGDHPVLAKARTYLAFLDQVEGNLVSADRFLEESLRISEAEGLKESIAQNVMWLSAHAEWRGDFPRAIQLAQKASAAAAEIHDGFFELMAIAFGCLAEGGAGHYAEALELINDGLTKARDRNAAFFQGRLGNSLGWVYQELGDFRRAHEHDRESADLGQRIKNANVEVSATINLGLDYLNLGEPRKALALLEATQTRVDKLAFGAHRWRWSIHTAVYLAEVLRALDEPERALVQVEPALLEARRTGSMKYVGMCHALRGELQMTGRQWSDAEGGLREALEIAQRIGYPKLLWQAADGLARALAAQGRMQDAFEASRVAVSAIEATAARAPEPALRDSFMNWPRVQAALETAERLRRA